MTIALILRYWREGIIALCLIAVGVQSLRLAASEREAAKWQSQLVKANALIDVQNEAVKQLNATGERRIAAVERARQEAERATAAIRKENVRLRNLPPNGCPTPPSIMEAYQ